MKYLLALTPLILFAETPEQSCCPPVYGNPSHSYCPCSWGVEVAGEFLYLQPFEEGLSYAIRSDVRQTVGGADGTPGGPVIDLEPRWQPAFRVSIGYAPSYTARVVWMGFQAKTVNHASASLSPAGIGLEGTWMPAIDTLVLYSFAHFRWKLDFDAVDFELGKRYDVSPSLSFNPICSVRVAIIDQSFHAAYGPPDDEVHAMNNFRGVGPRFGVNSEWGFDRGWLIFGGCSASMLYGRFLTHYGFSSSTLPAEILIDDVDEKYNRLVPNADFAVGLGWGKCWSNNRWHFGVRLSYEAHLYWDQYELRQPIGSDAPALAILQTRDLSIQGFALRGQFEF